MAKRRKKSSGFRKLTKCLTFKQMRRVLKLRRRVASAHSTPKQKSAARAAIKRALSKAHVCYV